MSQFLKVSKANMHIHITGSLFPNNLRAIASKIKYNFPIHEQLEKHFLFSDDLIWKIAKDITSTEDGLFESIKQIIYNEEKDNVTLIELTINPAGMIRRGMNQKNLVKILYESTIYALNRKIKLKFKLGVNRKDGSLSVKSVEKVFNALPKELKVSIDLNGNEVVYPTQTFVAEFRRLSQKGIPITIHAGEHSNLIESFRDALAMEPTRIAHALVLSRQKEFFEILKKKNIVIEVSPHSSLATSSITTLQEHIIRDLITHDIPFVLGSDDPAFFKKNMSDQLTSLLDMGFSESAILELNRKTFNYAL